MDVVENYGLFREVFAIQDAKFLRCTKSFIFFSLKEMIGVSSGEFGGACDRIQNRSELITEPKQADWYCIARLLFFELGE
jgi:hypothetical protein